MSKALICDKCKTAFSEQSATHIEPKRAFITTQFDLCPSCAKEFTKFMFGEKYAEDVNDE